MILRLTFFVRKRADKGWLSVTCLSLSGRMPNLQIKGWKFPELGPGGLHQS